MKTFGGGPVLDAAKEYVSREDACPILKKKISNVLALPCDEARHYHLKTLLQRAGVGLKEEE